MIRFFFTFLGCLVLAVATLPAFAQTVPYNEPAFGCAPQLGKGFKWGLTMSPAGGWISHWCRGKDNAWHLRILAQPASDMVAQADAFSEVLNAPDYNVALDAFMTRYPSAARKVSDPTIKPIWFDNVAKIEASRPAEPTPPVVTPPAQKLYVVAPNGTSKTRQWYAFNGGARTSTTGGGSVTIANTVCKPEAGQVTEGTTLYAAFGPTFRADRVTVCIPQ